LTPEQLAEAQAIREKKAKMILASREKRVRNHAKLPRKVAAAVCCSRRVPSDVARVGSPLSLVLILSLSLSLVCCC